jgi:hypothetical protein
MGTVIELANRAPVEMSAEAHRRYVALMRSYYEAMAPGNRPENWDDIAEVLTERDAIEAEAVQAFLEKRIFRKVDR